MQAGFGERSGINTCLAFSIGHQVGAYGECVGNEKNVEQITAAKGSGNTEKENIEAAVVSPVNQVIGVVC